MIIRGCKTIAEYAVRQWMDSNGFVRGNFELTMNGNDATITDQAGGNLTVRYDPVSRSVAEVEPDLDEVEERA